VEKFVSRRERICPAPSPAGQATATRSRRRRGGGTPADTGGAGGLVRGLRADLPRARPPAAERASSRPRPSHAEGLRAFRREYGRRCRAGLLLHAGEEV